MMLRYILIVGFRRQGFGRAVKQLSELEPVMKFEDYTAFDCTDGTSPKQQPWQNGKESNLLSKSVAYIYQSQNLAQSEQAAACRCRSSIAACRRTKKHHQPHAPFTAESQSRIKSNDFDWIGAARPGWYTSW